MKAGRQAGRQAWECLSVSVPPADSFSSWLVLCLSDSHVHGSVHQEVTSSVNPSAVVGSVSLVHFTLERKRALLHDYVSRLQCVGGGASLSMQNGRDWETFQGNKKTLGTFPAPHSESTDEQGWYLAGVFSASAALWVLLE